MVAGGGGGSCWRGGEAARTAGGQPVALWKRRWRRWRQCGGLVEEVVGGRWLLGVEEDKEWDFSPLFQIQWL
jgi:hypothetical protein